MGPVDGHDVKGLTRLLRYAASVDGPVLLHVKTVKGRAFLTAEKCPDEFHGLVQRTKPPQPTGERKRRFPQRFGRDLVHLAQEDSRICAITAAMTDGTGLSGFAKHSLNGFSTWGSQRNTPCPWLRVWPNRGSSLFSPCTLRSSSEAMICWYTTLPLTTCMPSSV